MVLSEAPVTHFRIQNPLNIVIISHWISA